MAEILVLIAVPIVIAIYLAMTYRRHGARRLWRDTALFVAPLAVLALIKPAVVWYDNGPRAASGSETWPFPVAVIAIALVVQALGHPKIPTVARIISGAIAGVGVAGLRNWIS